jgi:hypothetical protein
MRHDVTAVRMPFCDAASVTLCPCVPFCDKASVTLCPCVPFCDAASVTLYPCVPFCDEASVTLCPCASIANAVKTSVVILSYLTGSIPAKGKIIFSAPKRPDRLWGPTELPIQWAQKILSSGTKRSIRKVNHSASPSTEFKNQWSYTPLHHTPSRCAHGQRYLYTTSLSSLLLYLMKDAKTSDETCDKGKGKVFFRTGHEGPEGEYRYSSTLSLTLALDEGGWSTSRPGHLSA